MGNGWDKIFAPDVVTISVSLNDMSGIYIHIPFCRKACTYCNFHFSTNLIRRSEMLDCILAELEQRCDFLEEKTVRSIYLGGGTPSVLGERELERLFSKIYDLFEVDADSEITLESNPDDLNRDYLKMLSETPVNRLSIGIQCLDEEYLRWMNRSHNLHQAISSVENALELGFNKLTADLIFGLPHRKSADLLSDLEQFKNWGLRHFSAYALTVEPKTVLDHQIKTGKMQPLDEEASAQQFELLMGWAENNQYEQYEISNFAKNGCRAVHNSSYWKGLKYLGCGPSAHSFDGEKRYWNISNNALYMKSIENGQLPLEMENLSPKDRYNEYVLTGLRLIEGISLERALELYPGAEKELKSTVEYFLKLGYMKIRDGGNYALSRQGKLMADYISSEMMVVE